MRDHDDVEFLDAEPGDGRDEELAQPAGFPRLRRARLPLLVAGAVGLVAIVAVDVVQGQRGTPAAGPATVTATPSPSRTTPTPTPAPSNRLVILLPSSGKVALSGRDLTCAVDTSCEVRLKTPHAVGAAIHDALPHAHHLRTISVVRTDQPGSAPAVRRITGRVGVARLSISIRPAADVDRLGWNAAETASQTVATVDDHVGSRLISLRLSAPPGYPLDIAAVRRLAADPRLISRA